MTPESVVARTLNLPRHSVSDSTSNENVTEWDSVNHVTLILALEATFEVSFSAEEALEMTDLATIKRVLRTHGVDWDEVP